MIPVAVSVAVSSESAGGLNICALMKFLASSFDVDVDIDIDIDIDYYTIGVVLSFVID